MSSWRPTFLAAVLILAGIAGCRTVHQVTVDAISDQRRPMGSSYHLVANDPTGGVHPEQHDFAIATIKDALAARGLYEVPASTRPDMVIDAAYGIGHGYVKIVNQNNVHIMLGPTGTPQNNSKAVVVFDKTIELTARTGSAPAVAGETAKPGAELWSVKARIADPKQELGPYLQPLASALIDYVGENPGRELTFPVESEHAQVLLQQRPPAVTPAAR